MNDALLQQLIDVASYTVASYSVFSPLLAALDTLKSVND